MTKPIISVMLAATAVIVFTLTHLSVTFFPKSSEYSYVVHGYWASGSKNKIESSIIHPLTRRLNNVKHIVRMESKITDKQYVMSITSSEDVYSELSEMISSGVSWQQFNHFPSVDDVSNELNSFGASLLLVPTAPMSLHNNDPLFLDNLIRKSIFPSLFTIKGVQNVYTPTNAGASIVVRLKHSSLAANHISLTQFKSLLKSKLIEYQGSQWNESINGFTSFTIQNYNSLQELNALTFQLNNQVYRLNELAELSLKPTTDFNRMFYNGIPAKYIKISFNEDGNAVSTHVKLKKAVTQLNADLDKLNLTLHFNYNGGQYLHKAFFGLASSLLISILSIVTALFFIYRLKQHAALISLSIIPSIATGLIFLFLSSGTLNIYSAIGISISSGLSVDYSVLALSKDCRTILTRTKVIGLSFISTMAVAVALVLYEFPSDFLVKDFIFSFAGCNFGGALYALIIRSAYSPVYDTNARQAFVNTLRSWNLHRLRFTRSEVIIWLIVSLVITALVTKSLQRTPAIAPLSIIGGINLKSDKEFADSIALIAELESKPYIQAVIHSYNIKRYKLKFLIKLHSSTDSDTAFKEISNHFLSKGVDYQLLPNSLIESFNEDKEHYQIGVLCKNQTYTACIESVTTHIGYSGLPAHLVFPNQRNLSRHIEYDTNSILMADQDSIVQSIRDSILLQHGNLQVGTLSDSEGFLIPVYLENIDDTPILNDVAYSNFDTIIESQSHLTSYSYYMINGFRGVKVSLPSHQYSSEAAFNIYQSLNMAGFDTIQMGLFSINSSLQKQILLIICTTLCLFLACLMFVSNKVDELFRVFVASLAPVLVSLGILSLLTIFTGTAMSIMDIIAILLVMGISINNIVHYQFSSNRSVIGAMRVALPIIITTTASTVPLIVFSVFYDVGAINFSFVLGGGVCFGIPLMLCMLRK